MLPSGIVKLSPSPVDCGNEHAPLPRIPIPPPEIISHAVWLYPRFSLSFRDVEELLAERGITVSYEAIRLWCLRFGPQYARRLKRRQGHLGDTWYLDELLVSIRGRPALSLAGRRSRRRRDRYLYPAAA